MAEFLLKKSNVTFT